MALSVTFPGSSAIDLAGINSGAKIVYAKLVGDSSYPNGTKGSGYVVTPATFGLASQIISISTINPANQGWYTVYDPIQAVVRFMISGASSFSEAVSATSVASTLDVMVIGY